MITTGKDPTMWPTITVLAVYGAIAAVAALIAGAGWIAQEVRARRRDRAWAAGVAADLADAQGRRSAEVAALEALYAMESAEGTR